MGECDKDSTPLGFLGFDPKPMEKAVQFPTTWGDDHPDPSIPGACVVKMTWWRGRFRVYYADGETYTEVDGHRR